jgi:hypothetical protein
MNATLENGRVVNRSYKMYFPGTEPEATVLNWCAEAAPLEAAADRQKLERLRGLIGKAEGGRSLYFYFGLYDENAKNVQQMSRAETREFLTALLLDNQNAARPHWENRFRGYVYDGDRAYYNPYGGSATTYNARIIAEITVTVGNNRNSWDNTVDIILLHSDINAITWLLANGYLTERMLDAEIGHFPRMSEAYGM